MAIYHKAVKRPITTILFFVALVVFGIYSLLNTPIDLYPEFNPNSVMVFSSYKGASAEDVETNLTKVLENALFGVENLKNISSVSKENSSIITLSFNEGIDMEAATNSVRDKLGVINSALPEGATNPVIFKFSTSDIPIMMLSATADKSLPSLYKILDNQILTALSSVKGVGTVSISGAPMRDIKVYCDPLKLQAYSLTLNDVSALLAQENNNVPSGSIDVGSHSYSFRVKTEIEDVSDLKNMLLSAKDGKLVYLKDVATIVDGSPEKYQSVYVNGTRAADIVIQKQSDANTVEVIKGVKAQLQKISADLPEDIELYTVWDGSDPIKKSIQSLLNTIIITFIVVLLVVLLFLSKFRATFIIVLSIPISLFASLMYLYMSNNSLNIISMAALSLAIGMVVDDAIVVLENISNHIDRGEKPMEAAVKGTKEVGISVIASTLTMLCVFMPLTMIKGIAGLLFSQLGWIVSLIMTVSTFAALSLVPMLCSRMLKAKDELDKASFLEKLLSPFNRAFNVLTRFYESSLRWALSHKRIVLFSTLVLFVLSLFVLGPRLKTEFFPSTDQGRIRLNVNLPVGSSEELLANFAHDFDNAIRKEIKEIRVSEFSYGEVDESNIYDNLFSSLSSVVKFEIVLLPLAERERSINDVAAQIKSILSRYPLIVKSDLSTRESGMSNKSDVSVELYSHSFEEGDKLANSLKNKMLDTDLFSEVLISRDEYQLEYKMIFDREKLSMNGISIAAASQAFSAAVRGIQSTVYRTQGDEYKVWVRYSPEARNTIDKIENLSLVNYMGKYIKFKDLGELKQLSVPPSIERKDRRRLLTINATLAPKKALSDAVASVKDILKNESIPHDMSVKLSGQFEDQQEVFKNMFILLILIILLVYIVMASQFESLKDPFVIMLSLPFAIVGVLLGLYVTSSAFGIMAFLGLLILQGIVVKNGIVLIDYALLLKQEGLSMFDAILKSAVVRFRPIMMTTLTTVLGMLPIAIGIGEGSEAWKSLGITVCWGLGFSSLITLILIPVIYLVFSPSKGKLHKA